MHIMFSSIILGGKRKLNKFISLSFPPSYSIERMISLNNKQNNKNIIYDYVIKNGTVIDPKSELTTLANVGIIKDKIGIVTRQDINGKQVVDATNKIVCPGFIDIHSHLDSSDYAGGLSVAQGITTSLTGNCGISEFPIKKFLDKTEQNGYILNQATCVGQSWKLRELAGLKDPNAVATPKQIAQMAEYAEQALAEGAYGISLGVEYAPATTKEEIIALAKVASKYDKLMPVHSRYGCNRFAEDMNEFMEIVKLTGVKLQISHLGYQYGYGQMDAALLMIDKMWEQGYPIMCDSGLYEAFATFIGSEVFAPGWLEWFGCSMNDLVICSGPHAGKHCTEELYQEIRAHAPQTVGTAFVGKLHEFIRAIQHPAVVVCTDAGLGKKPGDGHPQDVGTFPKLLGRVVREQNALTLMEAIRKSTILPAQIMGLDNKGWLGTGADADIVIFDPNRVIDKADYSGIGEADALPEGIEYVFVNGTAVVENEKVMADRRPGKVLREENKIWTH